MQQNLVKLWEYVRMRGEMNSYRLEISNRRENKFCSHEFHHLKWNFISVKMTDMKSIPALSFERTCALYATSNESALIHFFSGKLCSHENLMLVWSFISVKMTNMKSIPLSFISPQFMWTQVTSWLNTEVRFSTEMKSHTNLSSFHLSYERTLICKNNTLKISHF